MTPKIDGNQIRKVLLEVLDEYSREGSPFTSNSVLVKAEEKLGFALAKENAEALLTFFYDLFRTGHLSWGYNLSNPAPPWCHLTDQGRRTLENLSRDPANPDGYMGYISKIGIMNPIALSYLIESLKTYNSDCFKAAGVMIGVAAESIALELKDALLDKIKQLGRTPPRDLADWRIKKILDAIKNALDGHKKDMPKPLAEAFESFWPAFTYQVRATRNEAGHPLSIESAPDTVHASLLIFPELFKLTCNLKEWILTKYA